MKLLSSLVLYLLFPLGIVLPVTIADLNSDKQALLDFAAAVPHRRKLNWNLSTPVCRSWVGIACDANESHVASLRLPGIGLIGSIPANTLGRLDGLKILSLRSNLLNGNLPSDIASLPSLNYLYLQHNNLSGSIPAQLSSQISVLDLSYNTFHGSIPPTIENLTQLTRLNLQNNSLSGQIPKLDLPNLKQLNLSYNHLNGSIPRMLAKFPNSSFEGNALLCGSPLNPCFPSIPQPPPSPTSPRRPLPQKHASRRNLGTGVIIAIAVGGSVLLLLVALVIIFCCIKKKDGRRPDARKGKGKGPTIARGEKAGEDFGSGVQESEKNKLVFFEGSSYNFDLEDLLRASAEVLGKGSYGTAYKAILEESTVVVVKRLKEVMVGKKDFEQQMEIIGRVGMHPNVVPLRAYYFSKDEKLLVYDYYAGGNLSTLLHGSLLHLSDLFTSEERIIS